MIITIRNLRKYIKYFIKMLNKMHLIKKLYYKKQEDHLLFLKIKFN